MLQTLHLALLETPDTHPASTLAVFGVVMALLDDECLPIDAIEMLLKTPKRLSSLHNPTLDDSLFIRIYMLNS